MILSSKQNPKNQDNINNKMTNSNNNNYNNNTMNSKTIWMKSKKDSSPGMLKMMKVQKKLEGY